MGELLQQGCSIMLKQLLKMTNQKELIFVQVRTILPKQCSQQSAEEITEDIMDIVNTCRSNCIEQIFVSSITCRPNHQTKVDKVNNLLKYYAGIYKFIYTDNSCIKSEYINRDEVHLSKEGVQL